MVVGSFNRKDRAIRAVRAVAVIGQLLDRLLDRVRFGDLKRRRSASASALTIDGRMKVLNDLRASLSPA